MNEERMAGSLASRQQEWEEKKEPTVKKNKRASKEEVQAMRAYILENHTFMTVADMAEALGKLQGSIDAQCVVLGVKPITLSEQTRRYLLEHGHSKSKQQLMRILRIKETYLEKLLKLYAVDPLEAPNCIKGPSVREIMSRISLHKRYI